MIYRYNINEFKSKAFHKTRGVDFERHDNIMYKACHGRSVDKINFTRKKKMLVLGVLTRN